METIEIIVIPKPDGDFPPFTFALIHQRQTTEVFLIEFFHLLVSVLKTYAKL